ncbi:MAG TPA: hypothetical protein VF079_09040 [Sphingomicrobium sp.]
MIALALLAAAAAQAWPLTPDGWGPVRIGMTQRQVEKALHTKLEGEPIPDQAERCIEKVSDRHPGLWFMFEDGRLTRISLGDESKVTTPRGIGIGASAAAVRRAYGKALKAEPHEYDEPPAEYLTFWTVAGKRGVRFETDPKRRVGAIHAGGPSIEYIEGCL